ncbi:hypothetical protein BS78_01G453900 [Paspalum vaginatum]|nr:hypothetical protein BS78_01G453900 [Paspalum vaginatum]
MRLAVLFFFFLKNSRCFGMSQQQHNILGVCFRVGVGVVAVTHWIIQRLNTSSEWHELNPPFKVGRWTSCTCFSFMCFGMRSCLTLSFVSYHSSIHV